MDVGVPRMFAHESRSNVKEQLLFNLLLGASAAQYF